MRKIGYRFAVGTSGLLVIALFAACSTSQRPAGASPNGKPATAAATTVPQAGYTDVLDYPATDETRQTTGVAKWNVTPHALPSGAMRVDVAGISASGQTLFSATGSYLDPQTPQGRLVFAATLPARGAYTVNEANQVIAGEAPGPVAELFAAVRRDILVPSALKANRAIPAKYAGP